MNFPSGESKKTSRVPYMVQNRGQQTLLRGPSYRKSGEATTSGVSMPLGSNNSVGLQSNSRLTSIVFSFLLITLNDKLFTPPLRTGLKQFVIQGNHAQGKIMVKFATPQIWHEQRRKGGLLTHLIHRGDPMYLTSTM